jgi:hypothetical protein
LIKPIITLLLLITPLLAQYERIEYSAQSDTIPQSIITQTGIDSIFTYINSYSWLVDYDDCNICKSRAHIICRMIEKKFTGITIAKAWLIADSKRISQKETYRYKPVVYLSYPGKCQGWIYHVAPVIITAADTFVIDPATQTTSVKLNKWAGGIIPAGSKGYMIIKDDMFYFYPETANDMFDDESGIWDLNNSKLTDNKYLRSVDETLQAKHRLYEPWKFNYYVSELMKLLE